MNYKPIFISIVSSGRGATWHIWYTVFCNEWFGHVTPMLVTLPPFLFICGEE